MKIATAGPQLPFSVSFHCMVQIDVQNFLIVGGKQDNKNSRSTWIIEYIGNQFKVTEGALMNQDRRLHSCGRMIDKDGKTVFIAVGGKDQYGKSLDTVELLYSPQSGVWRYGTLT